MDEPRIGVFLTTCDEDRHWLPQWVEEVDRLGLDFTVHFDRCSLATVNLLLQHRRCVGCTSQDNPKIEYTECHKQGPFDLLVKQGYDWVLLIDSDETLEKDAPTKLRQIVQDHKDDDCLGLKYRTLWDTRGCLRVDGPLGCGYHVKLYNLMGGRRWSFKNPIVNGAYILGRRSGDYREVKVDLVCLNHGAMTEELRRLHKERWDRIYGALGGNPYGFWNYCLDPSINSVIVDNPYL